MTRDRLTVGKSRAHRPRRRTSSRSELSNTAKAREIHLRQDQDQCATEMVSVSDYTSERISARTRGMPRRRRLASKGTLMGNKKSLQQSSSAKVPQECRKPCHDYQKPD